jgi:hypothetical protein
LIIIGVGRVRLDRGEKMLDVFVSDGHRQFQAFVEVIEAGAEEETEMDAFEWIRCFTWVLAISCREFSQLYS